MRNPKERLKDILEAIANIERYAARGCAASKQEAWRTVERDPPALKHHREALVKQ